MARTKTKEIKGEQKSPARFIIASRPHRITGAINLPGLEDYDNEHESNLERIAMRLFGFCHDVERVASQPRLEILKGARSGKQRHYPDVAVQVAGHERIVEVKPVTVALSEKLMPELRDLGNHYVRNQIPFDIVTDDQVNLQPRLWNAALLRRYMTSPVSADQEARLLQRLESGPLAISDIGKSDEPVAAYRDVCALIARRKVCFDWSGVLGWDTLVSLPNQPFQGLHYEHIIASGRFHSVLRELALGCEPSDQRLVAAARTKDWSIPPTSGWEFVDGLPRRAFVGRQRTTGSLLSPCGESRVAQGCEPPGGSQNPVEVGERQRNGREPISVTRPEEALLRAVFEGHPGHSVRRCMPKANSSEDHGGSK